MKRYISMFLSIICVLSLAACSQDPVDYNITCNDEMNETSEDETEQWDLIPMVMVNGELYLDTGRESTIDGRCGVMDGKITSEVDRNKQPTEDNQSNFGTGYGWQYGSHEGIIEIYMNDKWWVFATEKAIASSKLMVD